MDYSSIANLPNLGPGSTGSDVQKLQQWLVQNGFLTQAQMNTGPGIYGPQTAAAVAAWQNQAGFDTGGNPGWFGPLSKKYITQQSTTPKTTDTQTQTTQQPSTQKALLSAVADVAQSAAATGKPPVTFADALALAAKDPNIVAKYSDMAKLDDLSFTKALDDLRLSSSTEQRNLQTQFQNERRQLASASAASGTAYSGYRQRAQKELAQTESGIVQSKRAELQKNLQDLTTAFESKYGTAATKPATANFIDPMVNSNISISGEQSTTGTGPESLAGQLAGGVTGSIAPEKSADINKSALNSYNAAQFPQI